MTPFELAEGRAYCVCGGWLEVDTPDPELAEGMVGIFWAAHSTAGHAPASATVPRLIRRRREREAAEAWGAS